MPHSNNRKIHTGEYRFIKNEEIVQEIITLIDTKMKEIHLGNEYFHGSNEKINFEVDLKNIGNVLAYCYLKKRIDEYDDDFIGNFIIPIYIPEVKSIKEVINDLTTNKHIKYQIFPPTIKTGLLDKEYGFYRYISTFYLIVHLGRFIDVDDEDIIYNIIPPEGDKGTYVIHESHENGQIFKTLFNVSNYYKTELIQTNRPKIGIFNRLASILNIHFHEKFKNGKEYKKLYIQQKMESHKEKIPT